MIAIPFGDDGMGLHGVVILKRRFHFDAGRLGRLLAIALKITRGEFWRRGDTDRLRVERFAIFKADPRLVSVIGRLNQPGAFDGGFERLGEDNRDWLASIADLVVLQDVDPGSKGRGLLIGIL